MHNYYYTDNTHFTFQLPSPLLTHISPLTLPQTSYCLPVISSSLTSQINITHITHITFHSYSTHHQLSPTSSTIILTLHFIFQPSLFMCKLYYQNYLHSNLFIMPLCIVNYSSLCTSQTTCIFSSPFLAYYIPLIRELRMHQG